MTPKTTMAGGTLTVAPTRTTTRRDPGHRRPPSERARDLEWHGRRRLSDEDVGDKDEDGIPDQPIAVPGRLRRRPRRGGCPDEGRVVVEKSFIKITESIYFDTGKATIDPGFDLLDEIARVIANPS